MPRRRATPRPAGPRGHCACAHAASRPGRVWGVGWGERALPVPPHRRAQPGHEGEGVEGGRRECVCVCGEMASLIPAAASSPAGAPSRSKKRPASPGTGSGPAKKKKTTAPGGSQVTEGGPGGRRACAGASSPPPFRACSRRGGAGRPLPQAGSAGVASPPAGTVVSLCVPRQPRGRLLAWLPPPRLPFLFLLARGSRRAPGKDWPPGAAGPGGVGVPPPRAGGFFPGVGPPSFRPLVITLLSALCVVTLSDQTVLQSFVSFRACLQ